MYEKIRYNTTFSKYWGMVFATWVFKLCTRS